MPLHPQVRAARDFLLQHRTDFEVAAAGFTWPRPAVYNFATDWFDGLAQESPDAVALWAIDGSGESKLTFADLSARSIAAAHLLADLGLRRGDRLLLALDNGAPLWELILAAIRLGAVAIPVAPRLSAADLTDRAASCGARLLVAALADTERFEELRPPLGRLAVGAGPDLPAPADWQDYRRAYEFMGAEARLPGCSRADDFAMMYFTPGTAAASKLVPHTQVSYPIGQLSTMYWLGLQPGDIHLNISSADWSRQPWSHVFASWLAGATMLIYDYDQSDPAALLQLLVRAEVTTLCAPPTVWQQLASAGLAETEHSLRELASTGDQLGAELVEQIRVACGRPVRDGYGQTETAALVGNPPGAEIRSGSIGRPLPGIEVLLVDPETGSVRDDLGELCLRLAPRPISLTPGYASAASTTAPPDLAHFADGIYHTGDLVSSDADGYLTFVGRLADETKDRSQ